LNAIKKTFFIARKLTIKIILYLAHPARSRQPNCNASN